MNKAMIFTVTDTENCDKPIIWAQSASSYHCDNQKAAEELIRTYNKANLDLELSEKDIADIAYNMRHDGFSWHNEQYCFELSEVYG